MKASPTYKAEELAGRRARKKKRELIPPRMFRNHQCMSCKVCITGQVRSVEDEEEGPGAVGGVGS